jgi:hypothetical protein
MKQMLGIRMENEVKFGLFGTPEPVDVVISKPNLKHNLTIQPQPSATHTINSVQTFVNNVAIITSQEIYHINKQLLRPHLCYIMNVIVAYRLLYII